MQISAGPTHRSLARQQPIAPEPLFDRAVPDRPTPRDVPPESLGLPMGAGFAVGGAVLSVALPVLGVDPVVIAAVCGSACGAGILGGIAVAVWQEGRARKVREANLAAERAYKLEVSKHASSGRPPSPWPRLESLADHRSPLKELLSEPEKDAFRCALDRLEGQGVRLDATAGDLLERAPRRLRLEAHLPDGSRVRVKTTRDLRRLDLAYGHSDPTPFSQSLNSLLNEGWVVTSDGSVHRSPPDGNPALSRLEAFQALEEDRSGDDWAPTLNLHQELAALEFFQGAGGDSGLANPALGHTLKDLYASGLQVWYSRHWGAQTPLEAYRGLVRVGSGHLTTAGASTSYSEFYLPCTTDNLGERAQAFNAWKEAFDEHLGRLRLAPFEAGHAINAMLEVPSGKFPPDRLACAYSRLFTWMMNGNRVSLEAWEVFRRLTLACPNSAALEVAVDRFEAAPRMFYGEREFDRHIDHCLSVALGVSEVTALVSDPRQRGVDVRPGMVLVGGTRLRSKRM
ncbi:MAG: hypothetical protein AB1758_03790 [Candidatus Eremiobacterota bacterium]